jgi:PAS domain S-box-containing protein
METRAKILIVDDQPSNLDTLEAVLNSPDYELIRAQSAQDCLLALLKDEFAAIVLDIRMPGISGLELAQIIKQRKRTEHIPILFLTAHLLEEQDVLRGYGAGAVDYLSKPINPAILRSKVAVFVDLFRTTRALAAANAALEAEVSERHKAQEALRRANEELENRVRERTADLSLANEALWQNEERLRAILQNVDAVIYLVSADHRFLHINRKFEELFQLRNDAVQGKLLSEHLDARVASIFESNNRQAIEARVPVEFEEAIHNPAGELRIFRSVRAPLFDDKGAPAGVVGIATDVTDRLRIERERAELLESERQARADSERANRLKDEFLATVSHELRNPLHAVMGWAGLLRKSAGHDPKLADGLEIIERNAKVQAQLISDLLDISRITSGKMRLSIEQMDLGRVVLDAVDTVQHAAVAKGIEIHPSLVTDGTRMYGDPRRIQQIVWNLLSNAVKFTPPGGRIDVAAHVADGLAGITVADNGQGISPEFLPHLFDRFRQADASAARKHGGLGIGLAIARHLVELHGGRIQVESPGLGLGATFRIELPSDAAGPPVKVRRRKRRPISVPVGRLSAPRPNLEGIRVLVVEDEADGREFLKRVLEECAAEVFAAGSAQEGFQMFLDCGPDVVLSDIGMPGEDGYRFIERVRETGSEIPAVAVTAFARTSDREHALHSGYQAHLSKPLDTAELLATIAALLTDVSRNGAPVAEPQVHEPLLEQPEPLEHLATIPPQAKS